MTIHREISVFVKNLHPIGRIIACDVGEKTIGLALSDPSHFIASPLKTIEKKKKINILSILTDIIEENAVQAILIGMPYHLNGDFGDRCKASVSFAENLEKKISLPIGFWDERFSTLAVERTLIEADVSRAKRKQNIDKLAACYILQNFIDYKKNYLHKKIKLDSKSNT